MHNFILALFSALAILALPLSAHAQTRIEVVQSGNNLKAGGNNATSFHYLFENDRFTTPLQEIIVDGQGHGTFRFKRKDFDEVENKLALSAPMLSQLQSLFNELNFLSSTENYQHKKDFSHLGTVTITMRHGGQERTVKFNYTTNPVMSQIRDLFQEITTQETRVFEIEATRANDPISTPAQLRILESELRSKHIADPQRFVPILQDLKLDESVPLIARNHAERLLQLIKKGK